MTQEYLLASRLKKKKTLTFTRAASPVYFPTWRRRRIRSNSILLICCVYINIVFNSRRFVGSIQTDGVVPLRRTGRRYWHSFGQKAEEIIMAGLMCCCRPRLNLEKLCMPSTICITTKDDHDQEKDHHYYN